MPTVVLISCGKTKALGTYPAKELYQGDLFKKSYQYAKTLSEDVFILSAKYGLLHPDTIVTNYEKTLNNMPKRERIRWAADVKEALRKLYPILGEVKFVYLCGERYCEGLPKGEQPMKGLLFGEQLSWLKRRLEEV